jgi:MFS family permease
MFFSTTLICAGSLITSLANSLTWFLVGRSLTGAGGAGILIVATIVVIQMVSAKRRGLFIGLANTGMTVGLSLGAVIAGALEPRVGWVSIFPIPGKEGVCLLTRAETSVRNPGSPESSRGFWSLIRPTFRI